MLVPSRHRADTAYQPEYLSDLFSDRMISVTQDWGELRLDTSVGAAGQASPRLASRIRSTRMDWGITPTSC